MKHVLGIAALSVAMFITLVGCGGSAPSASSPAAASAVTPATTVDTSPGASATTSGTPSTAPAASASTAAGGITERHADQDLEAQLPSEVSGTPMTRYSVTLAQMLDAGGDRASIDSFLASIGKAEADGSIAAAFDPTNTVTGGIFAYRVRGADSAALLAAITSVEQTDLGADATTHETVGGKSVVVASIGSGVNDTTWLYGRGDIVFVVHAPDEAHAAAFLQALS